MTGTWALKITTPSTWPANTYIRSGSGNHIFWVRLNSTQSGTSVSQSMIECGRSVPPFAASMVSENISFQVPNSVFDGGFLPTYSQTLTLSNTSPGATISQPLTAFLLGTTMSNPTTAAWPSSSSGLTQVNMDGDANPGVTVVYLNTGGNQYPRVSTAFFNPPRSDNPYVGTRLVFSLQGSLTSCTQASGAATVTHINTRIFGCNLASSTNNCNTSQWQFLDDSCLNYTQSGSTYQMVKIAAGASCSAVRAALP